MIEYTSNGIRVLVYGILEILHRPCVILTAKCRRCDTEPSLEDATEMAEAEEAQRFRDVFYRFFSQGKLVICLLKAQIVDKLLEAHAVILPHQPSKMRAAVMRQLQKRIDAASKVIAALHLMHRPRQYIRCCRTDAAAVSVGFQKARQQKSMIICRLACQHRGAI